MLVEPEDEPEDAMFVMWEDLTSTPGYNAELGKSRDTVVRVNAEWYISEHLKVIALFDKYKVRVFCPSMCTTLPPQACVAYSHLARNLTTCTCHFSTVPFEIAVCLCYSERQRSVR